MPQVLTTTDCNACNGRGYETVDKGKGRVRIPCHICNGTGVGAKSKGTYEHKFRFTSGPSASITE